MLYLLLVDYQKSLTYINTIDYDEQFDKSFLEPLRFIVNAIDWSFERHSSLDDFF